MGGTSKNSLLDTWGAFTIGVMVCAFAAAVMVCYARKIGPWLADGGPPADLEPGSVCARNTFQAFNPIGNSVRCLYRPAAVKPGHLYGLDGVRAMAFLWVFAWQVDEFLAMISDKYKDSNWYSAQDEQLAPWKIASQGYEGFSIFLPLSAFLFTRKLLSAKQGEWKVESVALLLALGHCQSAGVSRVIRCSN